jgi:hypothetical protein
MTRNEHVRSTTKGFRLTVTLLCIPSSVLFALHAFDAGEHQLYGAAAYFFVVGSLPWLPKSLSSFAGWVVALPVAAFVAWVLIQGICGEDSLYKAVRLFLLLGVPSFGYLIWIRTPFRPE